VDHVILNGSVPAVDWRVAVGTYTLNPDCTGQATFTYPDGQSPGLTYFFVLTNYTQNIVGQQYSQIDIVVSSPAFNITAVGTRML
jgi:hypothetical protein